MSTSSSSEMSTSSSESDLLEISHKNKWRESPDKWRDDLRDLNFWLDGYRRTDAYHRLRDKLCRTSYVHWNVGVGTAASFTRAISTIAMEAISDRLGPFNHVIKVDLDEEEAGRQRLGVVEVLIVAVAKELGLLDRDEYRRSKEDDDELRYFTYGMESRDWLDNFVSESTIVLIRTKLFKTRYLLHVDNLYKPIERTMFLNLVGPLFWTRSFWVLSTTSQDVCDRSKQQTDHIYKPFTDDQILMIILSALHQSAKCIFEAIRQEDEQYWHRVALQCFHYTLLVLFPQCSPPHGDHNVHGDGDQQSSTPPSVTSDELIRQWAAQGILTVTKPRVPERTMEQTGIYHNKYDDIHQVGNAILQAFQEYSLLKLPFSPATEADAATQTAAQFLTYHGLVADRLTVNKLLDDKEYLEQLKWILLVDDQGWHVSKEWLSQETRGPTALIVRHCHSQPSRLFARLDHFLPKLPCLRVLDLSYTPIESLHPSIWCLLNLQLISLRGCYNLKSICSFSFSERTLTHKNSNTKNNLLYLDLSYSDINTFHCDLFQNMPNLQELLLVECSNLVELPPSIVALSSLITLELLGTQIKYFPEEIFEEMKKLQSLKLIDNKKLVLFLGSISKAHGLLNLHVEGWVSSTEEEIKLDGHPTLKSFSLISAPHVRCLSLRGCRKLESVDFRNLDALKDLDLSATAIKELPANIPNLPKLRQLLLVGVPSLRRFPWHELQRLPDVFCLDQCADGNGNPFNQVAHVCISDSRLFHSFHGDARDLVRQGQFFQSFYVRVAPCMVKIRKMQDEEDMVANKLQELVQKKSPYADVYCHYMAEGVTMLSMVTLLIRQTECHVEISAMNRYPHGLNNLLKVTKSITMTDDAFVSCLNDLSDLDELEECKLQRCHQMKQVFDRPYNMCNTLQNALASYLKSLIHFYKPRRGFGAYDFRTLKHLHLEYCPRLEDVMPCGSRLQSLTTLDIIFCYNLKTIFYTHPHYQGYSYEVPRLQRIRLQELPQLKHLCDDDTVITAPEWKELHVRGCWSLRRLPHLHQDQPSKVEVSGERAWWAKLSWDSNNYKPKLPPAFTSFDKHAKVTSYLR